MICVTHIILDVMCKMHMITASASGGIVASGKTETRGKGKGHERKYRIRKTKWEKQGKRGKTDIKYIKITQAST